MAQAQRRKYTVYSFPTFIDLNMFEQQPPTEWTATEKS